MAKEGIKLPQRAEIERIVREVLAELMAGKTTEQNSTRGELVLSSKVVSVAVLTGRLDGVSRIIMPRGAVVTPAARDLLRERRIAVASAVSPDKSDPAR